MRLSVNKEEHLDHEVRIRLMEELNKRVEHQFEKINQTILSMNIELNQKIDNQFKWVIGTIVTMVGGLILTKMV